MPIFRGFFFDNRTEVEGGLGYAEGHILGPGQIDHIGQLPVASDNPPHTGDDAISHDAGKRRRLTGLADLEAAPIGHIVELSDPKPRHSFL
jgi:hypothetical protein